MNLFTIEHTPAEIVKAFPQASDLFKQHHIDYCCGGDQPLHITFTSNNYDGSLIMQKLNTAYEDWKKKSEQITDWDSLPLPNIIAHIVDTHHGYLRNELSPLEQFVEKIYRVHGSDHPHLGDLYNVYKEFKYEMIEHSIKEEKEVFPLIKNYVNNPDAKLLDEIRIANGGLGEEHDHIGQLLKKIRVFTNDFQPPENACGSYRITYARLEEMEDNTFQYIHLENNVLFKQL